jgi:ABC-2 type transport system permease protein
MAMRAAALRNARQSRFGTAALLAAGVFGLLVAVSTLVFGITTSARGTGAAAQLGLLTLSWMAGRIGFAAFSGGDPAAPLDLFRIIPIRRRALARSLLLLGFADVATVLLGIALAGTVAYGFRQGLLAGTVGVLGTALTLIMIGMVSTIVAAAVPVGSRRRQDLGTLLSAGVISGVVVLGTLIQPLLAMLAAGQPWSLVIMVRILPSGWSADSVSAAAAGHPAGTLVPLAALAVGCLALYLWWPYVLDARLLSQATSSRHVRSRPRRRVLPTTATGAVIARELRLWIRDPNRAGFLLVAVIVGLGICVVPLVSQGTRVLLPFAGCGTAIIAGAIAGNGYGFDGASVAILLDTGAERADVRGRQFAWLLLLGPYTIALTVVGGVVAGQPWALPWSYGLLAAILGGAAGVTSLSSVIAPQPLDANGSPGPTWVVKTYASIVLIAVTTIPTLAVLIIGRSAGSSMITWLAVPVGAAGGAVAITVLGRFAGRLAADHGPEIYQALSQAGFRK